MKKQKYKDVLSGSEFTKISIPDKKHHYNLPSEAIPEDENTDQLKETLVGLEYDIEAKEADTSETDFENEVPDEDLEYLLANENVFEENYDEEDEDYVVPEEEDAALNMEATP
ncbi:MAG: hypothetical protein WC635_11325 [Bacteriovorax sp.]|jgi:hypothetical protein